MTPKPVLVAVLALLALPALAQSIDASGVWSVTPASVVYGVPGRLVTIHVNNAHVRFEPSNPGHPAADASGQCFGAILVRAGQVSGNGNCHYVDGDGETLMTEWTVKTITIDGLTTGRWAVVGGSGKWSGASGGGSFRTVRDADGGYRTEQSGEMILD